MCVLSLVSFLQPSEADVITPILQKRKLRPRDLKYLVAHGWKIAVPLGLWQGLSLMLPAPTLSPPRLRVAVPLEEGRGSSVPSRVWFRGLLQDLRTPFLPYHHVTTLATHT